jgi:hypothetical protein
MLINLGLGTTPPGAGYTWPVFVAGEPPTPDNVVTVYNTLGKDEGRSQVDGERQEHHGIQVRIRGATHDIGYRKARAIATALDRSVYQEGVDIDEFSYLVHCVSRTGDVLDLGSETPESKRQVFTINALVSLRES